MYIGINIPTQERNKYKNFAFVKSIPASSTGSKAVDTKKKKKESVKPRIHVGRKQGHYVSFLTFSKIDKVLYRLTQEGDKHKNGVDRKAAPHDPGHKCQHE